MIFERYLTSARLFRVSADAPLCQIRYVLPPSPGRWRVRFRSRQVAVRPFRRDGTPARRTPRRGRLGRHHYARAGPAPGAGVASLRPVGSFESTVASAGLGPCLRSLGAGAAGVREGGVMAGPRVTVLGSLNTDISVPVPHLPGPGETVLAAAAASIGTGGKGANQAVAAARLGAATRMVGCCGDDDFGGRASRRPGGGGDRRGRPAHGPGRSLRAGPDHRGPRGRERDRGRAGRQRARRARRRSRRRSASRAMCWSCPRRSRSPCSPPRCAGRTPGRGGVPTVLNFAPVPEGAAPAARGPAGLAGGQRPRSRGPAGRRGGGRGTGAGHGRAAGRRGGWPRGWCWFRRPAPVPVLARGAVTS